VAVSQAVAGIKMHEMHEMHGSKADQVVCVIAHSCPDRSALVKPARAKVHSKLLLTSVGMVS
jgi:hypothetical protein